VYCYCAHLGLRRFRLGLICLVNAKPNILMGTNLVIEILFVIGNCVIFFLNYRRVVQITEVFFL
jgi:hypothetical protein